jgi:GH25 family lysozyme M1 (1,4-beta-N-acetylmuramidase)
MQTGIDVGTSQAGLNFNAQPGSFVIVKASGANVGLYVAPHYRDEVDGARAAGKEIGHYFFNGNRDPRACAEYFFANLHDFRSGDVLVLDIEGERSTSTGAWSASQALAFATRVKELTGVSVGIYLNLSLMRGDNWAALVALGCWLWIAYPGSEPSIAWWPTWTMWQYTIAGGVDQNYSKLTLAEIRGSTTAPSSSPASLPSSPATASSGTWDFNAASADQARVQRALSGMKRYGGPIDGAWGENTIKGIQTTVAKVGYKGAIDGIPGANTCHFVQVYAQRFGDYSGPIDNVLGRHSWDGFALGLERK